MLQCMRATRLFDQPRPVAYTAPPLPDSATPSSSVIFSIVTVEPWALSTRAWRPPDSVAPSPSLRSVIVLDSILSVSFSWRCVPSGRHSSAAADEAAAIANRSCSSVVTI
eukprot:2621497-Prymnesium_polylepis.1